MDKSLSSQAHSIEPAAAQVFLADSGSISRVVLREDWYELIPPRELGAYLCASANRAVIEYVAQVASNPVPLMQEPKVSVKSANYENQLGKIDGHLRNFPQDLAEYRSRLTAVVQTPVETISPNGKVTVAMQLGQFTAIVIDQRWLCSARYTETSAELSLVMQAAQHASRIQYQHIYESVPDITKLYALMSSADIL